MILLLALVGAVLLVLIVVVIYLADRVRELERRSSSGAAAPDDDKSWYGLGGKRLWDAMTGKKGGAPIDAASIDALRPHYEVVLAKHIESVFRAGQSDARRGERRQPTSLRTIPSTRGPVESWMPLNYANALYKAGADSIKPDIFEIERARMSVDDTAQSLYNQTLLVITQPFSETLMPADPIPVSLGKSDSAPPDISEGVGSSTTMPAVDGSAPTEGRTAVAGSTQTNDGPSSQTREVGLFSAALGSSLPESAMAASRGPDTRGSTEAGR